MLAEELKCVGIFQKGRYVLFVMFEMGSCGLGTSSLDRAGYGRPSSTLDMIVSTVLRIRFVI